MGWRRTNLAADGLLDVCEIEDARLGGQLSVEDDCRYRSPSSPARSFVAAAVERVVDLVGLLRAGAS